MERQKRWQFWLIVAVIILTLYNILPTIFYYSKPLRQPIDSPRAHQVALAASERVNELESGAVEWLASFCKLVGLHPKAITIDHQDPRFVHLSFDDAKDAALLKRFLSPRGYSPAPGSLIPFVPAQLSLAPEYEDQSNQEVVVARQIGVHLDPAHVNQLFQFSTKLDNDGKPTPLYRNVVNDRVRELALAFGAPSHLALEIQKAVTSDKESYSDELLTSIAKEMIDGSRLFYGYPEIAERWYSSIAQGLSLQGQPLMQKLQTAMHSLQTRLTTKRDSLQKEQAAASAKGELISSEQQENGTLIENQLRALTTAQELIAQRMADFSKSKRPLTRSDVNKSLEVAEAKGSVDDPIEIVSLEGRNPLVQALVIDWNNDKIAVQFYPDVEQVRTATTGGEAAAYTREKLNRMIFGEIARVDSLTDELLAPNGESFAVALNTLTNSQSFLTFDLGYVADIRSHHLFEQLSQYWNPHDSDLSRANYPLNMWSSYRQLPVLQQRLGLVVYAPVIHEEEAPEGFSKDSIYVIAKGLNTIKQKYTDNPNAAGAEEFNQDFSTLSQQLQQYGFIGYSGDALFNIDPAFHNDYIFKLGSYYDNLVKATREDFTVKGSKRYAILDFTDVEQRILALNHIEDRIQEDLLTWQEEYNASQVDLDVTKHYLIPPPTKNVYVENFKISFAKYFRGDDRKILKWGLDLSGGKTVKIALRDNNGKPVTDPADLNQAVNELYNRLNKMGVAERTIRVENNTIVLDFPSSQGMSASELVKASAMYFHIVNEKFGPYNPQMWPAVNQFLQGVWDEAVVTNRKDVESLNEIAWRHLGMELSDDLMVAPRSEAATLLFDQGLKLSNPYEGHISSVFNDTLSSVAMMRGDDYLEWHGQSHPLAFVFHNYALEGANLTNIQVGWDQAQGNTLSFGVKGSNSSGTSNPRDDFYTWTSQFAEDHITGTPKEAFAPDKGGWRMAVILNGRIITMPSLHAALRDAGVITGRFTQREINNLAADLKAGSLSFTPRILSEQNVSPELGQEERTRGIMASLLALLLAVASMVACYRFGGVVASCAVLFNILIMWGVLQNIGAALTLPGLAGIVLTIGMAIDANVLVFERVREEFKLSGRIASAIQAGYRKAFSAIVDSNITTIIAAFILIQFDSGPIKGFAVTLIIGIVSSMFTALFMTRYFFAGWVQNPKNKELKMANLISGTNFDFLAQTSRAIIITVVVMAMGAFLFFDQRHTILGMDFTGGYSLVVEVEENQGQLHNYRQQAVDAMIAQGASNNDIQVRQLSYPWQLRIQLGTTMEEKGHPFYQLPMDVEGTFPYLYQHNPRISWIVNALEKGGLAIAPSQLAQLENHWTAMSGQFSDAMRNSALLGLALALLAILVYITIRFEFKYAVAAVVALIHDVLITLGVIAFCHMLGWPVQIDLQVIGAIMTIVGYSLNDTIIVFDRIREDAVVFRKLPFRAVVNHAINVTLSRTLMTSGTTLLVLLTLVFFGGESIFGFAFVMSIGVLVGTFSSLFIAAPVMLYLHDREERTQQLEAKLGHS